jgi:hypothetical protein
LFLLSVCFFVSVYRFGGYRFPVQRFNVLGSALTSEPLNL